MPGVAYGEGGENSFMEELAQTDRDVDFPDEWDVFSGVEAGREGSMHIG